MIKEDKMKSFIVIMVLGCLACTGCMNPKILRPINSQNEENLTDMSKNMQILSDTYLPVLSAYLDFKIQQMKVKKQNELAGSDYKLTPEAKIDLEFYTRDLLAEKKEMLTLLQELMSTIKEQSDIAKIHLEAYKDFTEKSKLTDDFVDKLKDSNLQMKALSVLKMDPNKSKRLQELLSMFQ
ncbi:MAG: hypothetical protein A2204_00140 [Elusimicrobia bacterium RIFOXYA1_FULL_47_7]|nr:MAG: hypothetical protein A2204_00140 [Elusimicrobia bacterium RIFOXYA1_FULL_47_7]OGS15744.1 MAG: hypothetical protein A2251_08660 [Elusimicrobia bacterium RIFOXYA2_FULL_47_53]OGS31045.1 MAG: hypothetical protein A2323_06980 [Elusimicrobia bacterium RIFOXYB2_FULL_46_23]